MSTAVVTGISAATGLAAGTGAWWVAQRFIEGRSLEKGDTEVRVPAPVAAGLTAATYAALGWRFGDGPVGVLVVYLALFAAFVTLALVDFARYVLPNPLIGATLAAGIPAVVVVSLLTDRAESIQWALVATLANFVVYFLFFLVAQIAFGNRGLGFGDVKLAAPLGLALGWICTSGREVMVLVFWAVFVGFLSGAVISIAMLRGLQLKRAFPQGPFLVLGTLVALVASARLLA